MDSMIDLAESALLAVIGLSSGIAVAGGIFAFITITGVVTRLAARTKTVKHVMMYEDAVVLGGSAGNLITLFGSGLLGRLPEPVMHMLLEPVFGIFAGIFVGCLSMALAEVVQVIPVFVRRIRLIYGLVYVVICFALGKVAGTLYQMYFAR